jgi:hypothetical protein
MPAVINQALSGHEPHQFTAENVTGGIIYPGMAVAVAPSGVGIVLAGNGALITQAIGLAVSEAGAGFATAVQSDGIMALSDWSRATGSIYLDPTTLYVLDTAGRWMPKAFATTAVGSIYQVIGRPVSDTLLQISIGAAILL